MNEKQYQRLERQVEDATSGEPLDPRWTDNDTSALREGWEALDRALGPLDEQCPDVNRFMPPEVKTTLSSSSSPNWRKLTPAIATVAASLLVAILATWMVVRTLGPGGGDGPDKDIVIKDGQPDKTDDSPLPGEKAPGNDGTQLVEDKTPGSTTPEPETPDTKSPEEGPSGSQLARDIPDWDDPLDTEIASTMTSMQALSQRINTNTVSYDSVWYQMNSLQGELDDGPL